MKIVIYFSHYETLGHAVRTLALAKGLAERGDDVLVLQGGKPQKYLETKGFEVIDIPEPYVGKNWFVGQKYRGKVEISTIKKRLLFMKKKLDNFKPDVFIVEFFPFGREIIKHEIMPLLMYLKNKNNKIKIVSSVGYPVLSFSGKKVLNYAKYFDKILIHCPEDVDSKYVLRTLNELKGGALLRRYYCSVFGSLKDKVVFTGYILPQKEITKSNEEIRRGLGLNKQKLVFVSRGGGAIYSKIMVDSILAKKLLGDNYFFVIAAGPSSSEKELLLFEKLAKGIDGIKIVKYASDFLDYLNVCDISISMSGYNTCVQIAFLGKKCILVPRHDKLVYSAIEQIYRGNMLKELLGSRVLYGKELSAKSVADAIVDVIKSKYKNKIDKTWFNGVENSYGIIHALAKDSKT